MPALTHEFLNGLIANPPARRRRDYFPFGIRIDNAAEWVDVSIIGTEKRFGTRSAIQSHDILYSRSGPLTADEMTPQAIELWEYLQQIPDVSRIRFSTGAVSLYCSRDDMERVGAIAAELIILLFGFE